MLGRLEEVLKLPEARVNLVIAATTRSEDVSRIVTRFQKLSPQRVIFTKMDETESRSAGRRRPVAKRSPNHVPHEWSASARRSPEPVGE
jgi:hypothetical protein